ncbi:DUF1361 domain-containing protein [Polaribacter aestuariivivens]|uniref:DUF1361 domain-containing protein n=1 Tax=Polaribacter aestuariivivens TaxID=2304626 RepID=A0A5S3N2L7_9FLAO|nr:DUF1361 domain-containing protein [Polaribacter aestuariivivens]TMM29525.1 DUF1361 domain-containing protein [Polaribacter aestuariivivens]
MMQLKKISNIHLLILFCLFLFGVRVKLTSSLFFGFLLWNLFLAIVPYAISSKIKKLNIEEIWKPKLISILFIWLIFLPNAPYIITDFIHLHHIKSTLIWLDLFIIFTYASTGLLLTIISLFDVYKIIKQKWNLKYANYFSYAVTFLCGFGIYLGRFSRLNSWDIFTNPISVLKKSMYSFNDTKTWLITFGFGTFIYLLFSIWKTQVNAHS